MHRTLPYLALFAVVVLLQVFLFDNLSISIYLNPLVYVAFIALLPLDTPPIVLLLSGLATGDTMDLAMGAAGENTIATLLIAFARPNWERKQAEKEALDPDANYTEDKGDFEIPVEDEPEEAGEEDTEPI